MISQTEDCSPAQLMMLTTTSVKNTPLALTSPPRTTSSTPAVTAQVTHIEPPCSAPTARSVAPTRTAAMTENISAAPFPSAKKVRPATRSRRPHHVDNVVSDGAK